MTKTEDIQKVAKLIKGIKVAMLTSQGSDGTLHSRPMWTQEEDFDGIVRFFTNEASSKSLDIKRDTRINLSYADTDGNRYVSLSGTGSFTKDRALIDKLWKDIYKAWFPKGKDDPTLSVLEVEVEKAEYWDSPGSTITQVIGFAKALVTGKKYEADDDEHGKVRV